MSWRFSCLPLWARTKPSYGLLGVAVRRHPVRSISGLSTKKQSSPLRILFCGSDNFSVVSLKRLYEEFKSKDSNIISIDVVTRTDKKIGRSNKSVYVPPIKKAALALDLPLHQIDTFTRWQPPVYDSSFNPEINLIVAVSFGLLIPMRIINGAEYGGLNVHPSMLPDFRGAAPLEWTIMHGLTTTGVSVQTLHPTKFDAGVVLDQTPPPGIKIPDPETIDLASLTDLVAPFGAEMLVRAIRNQLYVPPYTPVAASLQKGEHRLAPKFTSTTSEVDFQQMTREYILRLTRAVGKVPLVKAAAQSTDGQQHSLKLFGLRDATEHEIPVEMRNPVASIPIGLPYSFIYRNQDVFSCYNPLFVNVASDGLPRVRPLAIVGMTVAGKPQRDATGASARANFFADPIKIGPFALFVFAHPMGRTVESATSEQIIE